MWCSLICSCRRTFEFLVDAAGTFEFLVDAAGNTCEGAPGERGQVFKSERQQQKRPTRAP